MNSIEKKQKGVTRRDFIMGTAAGAVGGMAAGVAGTALAAAASAGSQPGPSSRRPFHRAMSAETVQLRGHEGDRIDAYLARPTEPGPYPGVVVIHHMPGWDESTHIFIIS